jgi:1-acyl-sn-glycerol-3-phosphate acyltransferase
MSTKRRLLLSFLRASFKLSAHCEISGRANIPASGPLLVVFNHLAHLDGPLVLATMPFEVEGIGLADLYRVPVTGQLMRLYGLIPVHRDQYDREVLRRALQVLAEGRVLALAPEARQSPTCTLERGRNGAAYLALRSGAPLLPIGITGTETMYSAWRKLRRPRLTVNIGVPFHLRGPLAHGADRHAQLDAGREQIMGRVAALLPSQYRGVYACPEDEIRSTNPQQGVRST